MMIARDVMQTEFHTLSPENTVAHAVRQFQKASAAEEKKVFGLMVTDENDHLVGILSMYDILIFIQPKHVHILGEMDDIDPSQLYDERLERVKSVLVGDIMTPEVISFAQNENLARVIEGLMVHRFGAVLIRDSQQNAVGVVSKSDLVVAYKHGMTVDATASAVMGTPVHACGAEADLAQAIQMMLFKDVQRIFVHGHDSADIVGILSLSDAARFRSGTCRACAPSRLMRD